VQSSPIATPPSSHAFDRPVYSVARRGHECLEVREKAGDANRLAGPAACVLQAAEDQIPFA
jgi:hypothetical protein